MNDIDLDFYRVLFDDLDPQNLVKRFLGLLLNLQNVERGSIWVKQEEHVGLEEDHMFVVLQ